MPCAVAGAVAGTIAAPFMSSCVGHKQPNANCIAETGDAMFERKAGERKVAKEAERRIVASGWGDLCRETGQFDNLRTRIISCCARMHA